MVLLNLLVSQNIITDLEARAIESQVDSTFLPVDEILSERGVSEAAVLTARNAIYGIPVYNGPKDLADIALYNLIDKEKSDRYLAVPLGLRDSDNDFINKSKDANILKNKDIVDEVSVGIVDPERKNVLDALQFILSSAGVSYKIYLISYSEFKRRTEKYPQEPEKDELQNPKEDITNLSSMGREDMEDITEEDHENISGSMMDSVPIVKMLNIILKESIINGASDIHIENIGEYVRVRTRIDGILSVKYKIPESRHASLVARVKILCGLKLDEKRKPQDGRFSVKFEGHKIDFRVSTLPAYYGEKVVIRILDSYRGVKKIEEIGLSSVHMTKIRKALGEPYGIILISGPTGSGKTTTLYSMINEIDKVQKNIVSLEDPIEYNISGINQSQIFPEIGYTFATGLRSILRQDPDVIFVGEIRDGETAQLAIQAALTGHLVFSTIHTNNAIGVITRLLDMGVDPYLIAPTLKLAIAQRLVRKIAPDCAVEINDIAIENIIQNSFKDLPDEFKKDLPLDKKPHAANSSTINQSGLKGRAPMFEMLQVDKEIEELILGKKSEEQIWNAARKKGMISMKEDAMIKSIEGTIPFIEVDGL